MLTNNDLIAPGVFLWKVILVSLGVLLFHFFLCGSSALEAPGLNRLLNCAMSK